MRSVLFSLCLAATATAACSRTPSELSEGPQPSPSAVWQPSPLPSAAMGPIHPVASSAPRVLALHWNDPPRWQRRVPSTPMRAAEYRVPRADGDLEDAECSIITFGPGQGGSVDDNIERWVKQLQPASSAVERTKRTVNGMAVTRAEVAGPYTPMATPGMPSSTTTPRQGQRLVGDIVEAPSGFWFFKMTGPDATVSAAAK